MYVCVHSLHLAIYHHAKCWRCGLLNMCKHDVMNIQQAHCGLVGPDRGDRKVGPLNVSPLARNGYSYAPFIAKSKAACGLCFHQLPWLIRKYDVIHKSEVHNVSQRHQRRTEPRP